MTNNDMEIVSALQEAMVDEVGRERFELWFGVGVRITLRGDSLEVSAGDRFKLDRIRRQFHRELQAAVGEVAPSVATIDYRVDSRLADSSNAASDQAAGAEATHCRSIDANRNHSRGDHADGDSKHADGDSKHTNGNGSLSRRRVRRLDQFVVGDSNRLAHTAAKSALARLGAASPLFIYGPPGCGKTHLLEGMAHAGRGRADVRRVLSMTAEQFTTSFLVALKGGGVPSFRAKHRDVDLLLIDDVQFFGNKQATLIELQHTIDTLLRENKQIVLAADRSPAELRSLGPELVARLSGGLVCGMEYADEATRRGILQRFVAESQLSLSDEVVAIIASQMAGDARQLAGAVNRLEVYEQATGQPITEQNVEEALQGLLRESTRVIRFADIDHAVCEFFGVDQDSLVSGRKLKSISQPRMLAMWLARKYTRAAYSEIGEHFGRRSHSTVISAQRKVDKWVSTGDTIQLGPTLCPIRDAVRRIEAHLRTG